MLNCVYETNTVCSLYCTLTFILFFLPPFTVLYSGYGNTAPATDGGQALVYVAGFLSIIAFGAVLGLAESVVVAIVEDALRKSGIPVLRALNQGFPAVLLWFAISVSWTLIFATVAMGFYKGRTGYGLDVITFQEYFWFSYITLTTVGFVSTAIVTLGRQSFWNRRGILNMHFLCVSTCMAIHKCYRVTFISIMRSLSQQTCFINLCLYF